MALPDVDSSVGHSFGLEVDGVVIKQIQEVVGLRLEQNDVELKQNSSDGKFTTKKLPGRFKAGEVTLTRGLTADNSFEKWVEDSRLGWADTDRKVGAIIIYDAHETPIRRYKLTGAWPKSLEIGTLKAGDTSVLTEKLVVTYEKIEVDQPNQ